MKETVPQQPLVPVQQTGPSAFQPAPQRISLVDFDMPFGRTMGFISLLIIAGFFGGIAVLLQYH
jgi:hypothetical protein